MSGSCTVPGYLFFMLNFVQVKRNLNRFCDIKSQSFETKNE